MNKFSSRGLYTLRLLLAAQETAYKQEHVSQPHLQAVMLQTRMITS